MLSHAKINGAGVSRNLRRCIAMRAGVCLFASVIALGGVAVSATGQAAGDEEPLPLLRIALTREQLAHELAKQKQGTLIKLPREEFEARVRKAAKAIAAARPTARIARAQYVAELSDQDLTQGRGEWVVLKPCAAPALLPLTPMSLALGHTTWENGGDAIVADFENLGFGVWVEDKGPASLFFDWSCRGTPTPQGLTFDLRLPDCAQTSMELKLPADTWPAIPAKSGLLTGPHDAGVAGKKLWKLRLAGKTQMELTLRKLPADNPALYYQMQSRQLVTPERIVADCEFQIEAPQGGVRELRFQGDGSLEPIEVTGPTSLQWRWEPPAVAIKGKPDGQGMLIVDLREPQPGATTSLRVRCLAPRFVESADWTSPGLRIQHAICRSETLSLTFHPDVHLGQLTKGDFHLAGGKTESDGSLSLTFADLRATLPSASKRPRCRLAASGTEFRTVQALQWHIAPEGTRLRASISYEVRRGQLHQLAIKLPTVGTRYSVQAVDVEPKELLRDWTSAGSVLLVDLKHGLTPRTDLKLLVELRSVALPDDGPLILQVPDVTPLGSGAREAKLAITVDPLFHARVFNSSVPPDVASPEMAEANSPAFAFSYRDAPLQGNLTVTRRPPLIRVNTEQEVWLDARQSRWHTRVQIAPQLGRPAFQDLYLSAALSPSWQVTAEAQPGLVQRVERLAVPEVLPYLLQLGATTPVGQSAVAAQLPRGQRWRIHFAHPLEEKTTLHLEGTFNPRTMTAHRRFPFLLPGPFPWTALSGFACVAFPGLDSPADWDVPVLTVSGVREQTAKVVVHSGDFQISSIHGSGIDGLFLEREVKAADCIDGRAFRLATEGYPFPYLRCQATRGHAQSAGDAICESSELTTCFDPDGMLCHLLRLRLRNWRESQFPIVIPAAVKGLAARVDGIWIDRLDTEPRGVGTRFSVPVNADAGVQQIELFYSSQSPGSTWPLLCQVAAVDPELPHALKPPLTRKQYWRLPGAWMPVNDLQVQLHRQPEGVRAQATLSSLVCRSWHVGPSYGSPAILASGVESQTAALAEAANVQGHLPKGATLGEALQQVAASLRESLPMVVDLQGLRARGLTVQTPLPNPAVGRRFWESVGLVHIPCPSGALFSTPERLQEWQERAKADSVGVALDSNLIEAATFGVDRTGGFASVNHWIRGATAHAPSRPSSELVAAFSLLTGTLSSGWTEWEARPGYPTGETLELFNASQAEVHGYFLAFFWLLPVCWSAFRLRLAAFLRFHVVAVSALMVGGLGMPTAPREVLVFPCLIVELLGFGIAFTLRAWPGRESTVAGRTTMIQPVGAAILAWLLMSVIPVGGQGPAPSAEPERVYLVASDEPGEQFALAAPELLKKLDDIVNRTAANPAGAVLVSANYQGQVKDGMASIEAKFDLYQFDERSTYVLPLTGVRLHPGVFLDGAPVFPVAHKSGGYAVPVRGKGFHRLGLVFDVRSALVNENHVLEFNIPKAGQSQIELSWTTPARGVHLIRGLGEAKVQLDKKGVATLRGQLGNEGLVKVRWPAAQGPTPPQSIEIREAYFWDLRPANLALTAAVQLGITKGSLTQARFALPEGIEVRSVGLARTGAAAPSAAIRKWGVVGKDPSRQLVVDFSQPVSGNVPLILEMVPRIAITPGSAVLRLPSPLVGTTTEGLLAYRLEGMEATPNPQNLSVATVRPELFAETWAKLAQRELPQVTEAASFRRTAPVPALGLALQPAHPAAHVDALWNVGPLHADLNARVTLSESGEDLVLVELELPPRFRLATVAGKQLHHWSRQDRLVQVWLQQPRKEIELQVNGWLDKPAGSPRFELAALRVLNVRAMTSKLAIEPVRGLKLRAGPLSQLTRVGKGNSHFLTSSAANYAASFALETVPMVPVARAFTILERRDAGVRMTTALHVQPIPGDSQVVVDGWTGDDLQLEAPPSVVVKGHQRDKNRNIWTLQFPPGLPQVLTLTVHGRVTADRTTGLCEFPVVQVASKNIQDHWIALIGVEPIDKEAVTLQIMADGKLPAGCPIPPTAIPADARAGALKDPGHGLALRLSPDRTTSPIRILSACHETAWAGIGWLHELRLLTFSGTPGEVRVRLPAGSQCRGVVVGDRALMPAKEELVIPVRGTPGPRFVQVFWSYPQRAESPMAPRLDRPTLVGHAIEVDSRLWLPAAYRVRQMPPDIAERAIDGLLRQADARIQLCALLAETAAPADAKREQPTVQGYLEEARMAIAMLERNGNPAAAQLKARVNQLDQQNAESAKKLGYQVAAGKGGQPSALRAAVPLWETGVPLPWPQGHAVTLAHAQDSEDSAARAGMEFTVLAGIALLVLSYLRRGVATFRFLWPEILIGVAMVGFAVGGFSLVGAGLLTVGLALRGAWVLMALQRTLAARRSRGIEQPGHGTPPGSPASSAT